MAQDQNTATEGALSPIQRVIVPVAGTDREFIAQVHGVSLAEALGVPLAAIHVTSEPDTVSDDAFSYLEQRAKEHGVACELLVQRGLDAADVILDELGATDLVVIGSSLLGGKYHFGSVAEALIRKAPCPVQVVRLE